MFSSCQGNERIILRISRRKTDGRISLGMLPNDNKSGHQYIRAIDG